MDWFWHALLVCVVVIPITIMWVAVVIEILRRHDLGAVGKVCWLVAILVFPLLGPVTYLVVTWRRAGSRRVEEPPLGAAPADPSTVSDLTALDRLRRSGTITEAEFAAGKRQILEGKSAPHASEEVGS